MKQTRCESIINFVLLILVLLSVSCSSDLKAKIQSSAESVDGRIHTQGGAYASFIDCRRYTGSECELATISGLTDPACPGCYRATGDCLPHHTPLANSECRYEPTISRVNVTVIGPGEVHVGGEAVSIGGYFRPITMRDESNAIDFQGRFNYADLTLPTADYHISASPDVGATARFSGDCASASNNYFSHAEDLKGFEHNCTVTFLANTTPPEDVWFGVTVKEKDTYTKLENALVTVGGKSCSTDSFGECSQKVSPGSQLVTVSKPGYKTYSEMRTFTRPENIPVFLELEAGGTTGSTTGSTSGSTTGSTTGTPAQTSRLTITVTDFETLRPIDGAQIQISNQGDLFTNSSGVVSLDLPHGTYAGIISKPGYVTHASTVPLSRPENFSIRLVPVTVAPKNCTDTSGAVRLHLEKWIVSSTSEAWENCPAPQDGSRLVVYKVTEDKLCSDSVISTTNRGSAFDSVKTNNCTNPVTPPPPPPPPPGPTHGLLTLCFVVGDGSPIQGVTVVANGPATGSGTTNASGCMGADVPFGTYSARASKDGASVDLTITHDRNGKVYTYNAATGALTPN